MLFYIYFVILCSNFLSGMSEDNNYISVELKPGEDCSLLSNYKFTDGSNITIVLGTTTFINFGWLRLKSEPVRDLIAEKLQGNTSMVVNKTMDGTWEFEFYNHANITQFKEDSPKILYKGTNYTSTVCRTVVDILNATIPTEVSSFTGKSVADDKYIIIGAVAGVSLLIIITQTAYIALLKAKAQRLNAHNNLSKKTPEIPPDENETARYCTNPVQKAMKVAAPVDDDDDEDEAIYEAPNIDLTGRIPMQPPQPPGINTIPRTPRADHNNRIGHQTMLPPAMNSPARSPTENHHPTFPRGRQNDRDLNVANRPPLPLPNQPQEVYEEMGPEDVYEPPPVNTIPPRLPMPPKKVPTAKLLDVKEDTLKLKRFNKPPVTPKPGRPRSIINSPGFELEQVLKRRNNAVEQHSTSPKTNELEQALRRRNNDSRADGQTSELEAAMRRRNNVVPVPITTISEPSRVKTSPRPPPLKSKPRNPPMPQTVQEEIYFNENQASSDEEWTYEPLKPYNNYDPNIYNI